MTYTPATKARRYLSAGTALSLSALGLALVAPPANAALDPGLPVPGKVYTAQAVTSTIEFAQNDGSHSNVGYTYAESEQTKTTGRDVVTVDNVTSEHALPPSSQVSLNNWSSSGTWTGTGAPGVSGDGAVSVGASQGRIESHYIDPDTCVPNGSALARATSTVDSVDLPNTFAGLSATYPAGSDLADLTAPSTSTATVRADDNGRTDTPAQALTTDLVGATGTFRLLDGAATVTILDPATYTATANGLSQSSSQYHAPTVKIDWANGSSQTITPVADPVGTNVGTVTSPTDPEIWGDLYVGSFSEHLNADGTGGNADMRSAWMYVYRTHDGTTESLGTLKIAHTSSYFSVPAGGVDCGTPTDADNDGLSDYAESTHGTNPSNPDTDGDGLTDGEEVNTSHTSPTAADSDGDGLADGAEVHTYATDPLKADTDTDGLNDHLEEVYGTDPWNVDTDGDSLTDGDEVYIHHTDPAGADTDVDGLTDGEEVNTYFTDPTKADSDADGLSDGLEVNDYTTDPNRADSDQGGVNDGEEVARGTDPLNADDDVVNDDTDSDGLTATEENRYGTDPHKPDTDTDGLLDGYEVKVSHTSPVKADTDGDGLKDGAEVSLGTGSGKPDTDGDGLTDGAEVNTYHTNPMVADSDGDGLTDGVEVNGYRNTRYHKVFRSNPLLADSDRDGLSDRVEVTGSKNRFGHRPTNPLKADTDRDGVKDGKEIKKHSNPNKKRSVPGHR